MQPDPEVPICGFNSITGYQVIVTGNNSAGLVASQLMNISRNESSCACTVPEGFEDSLNVSVAARNVLGLGDAADVRTYGKCCYMLTHTTVYQSYCMGF